MRNVVIILLGLLVLVFNGCAFIEARPHETNAVQILTDRAEYETITLRNVPLTNISYTYGNDLIFDFNVNNHLISETIAKEKWSKNFQLNFDSLHLVYTYDLTLQKHGAKIIVISMQRHTGHYYTSSKQLYEISTNDFLTWYSVKQYASAG